MDEAIAQVVTVTSCSPEVAAQYVQLSDGDPNQAVQLYFENGGADLTATSSSAAPQAPSSSRVSGAGNSQDPINIDDDHVSDDNDPVITGYGHQQTSANTEDDEAMARRLQEEMYGDQEQTIRAPIARQAETLLGPGADGPMSGSMLDDAVQERMIAFQHRRRQGMWR